MKRSIKEGVMVGTLGVWLCLAPMLFCLGSGCADQSTSGYKLSNGVTVVLPPAGGVELTMDGRDMLAIPSGAVPVARRFSETIRTGLAIFDFQRESEERLALSVMGKAEKVAGGMAIPLSTRDGDLAGQLTIEPTPSGATRLRLELDGPYDSLALPVRCDQDGSFHGFGEQYNATDQRGEAFSLLVSEQGTVRHGEPRLINGDAHTTYFPMPYYLDARGFGVLIETAYRVDVDICKDDREIAWFEVVSPEPLEIIVFSGPEPIEVVEQLGSHVGRPDQPPDWAFSGTWICSQGGRAAVEAEVDALEAAAIPVNALWIQDWSGIRQNVDGGFGVEYRWEHDPELYPDLAGLVDSLHQRGYKVLTYANPFVDPDLPNHFSEMDDAGLLVKDPDSGSSYLFLSPAGQSAHPDLSNPAAREYVKQRLKAKILDLGIDGWMTDFGEWLPLDAVLHDGSHPMAAHNLYPSWWQSVTRQAMTEARPDGDWVMYARSGWSGTQAVAQIHWVGDQDASFEEHDGLPTVVPAMLNLGLCGQPYATHDIAGFSGGPSSKELYLRWTELGAFTPIMRTHEGNDKLGNWSWEKDPETTAHFRRFSLIHKALAPEFIQLAQAAQTDSAPMVRHLMLSYPEDKNTWSISDQYLLGEKLLVAPILHQGQNSRQVYLPSGDWYHVWSGEHYQGGQSYQVDAPMGSPPVFSRDADRSDLREIQ